MVEMYRIALQMLMQDKPKFIGLILSLSFSALIITQQAGIFIGLMMRTYSIITDTSQPAIWVMDPNVKMIDDIKYLRDTDLYRVRSIRGVAWAVPMFKGLIQARLQDGQFQTCVLIGIDDATLIGGPHTMLEGKVEYLRFPQAIIVDRVGAGDKLALGWGKNEKKALAVGDILELNDLRAKVVGICSLTRTFQSQPVVYTTYKRALEYSPYQRKLLSFVLAYPQTDVDPKKLCATIKKLTNLAAYTTYEFKKKTVMYYLKNTGIPINFGLAILLGILIGAAIAGQIFYNFVSDNLKALALFSLMGASRSTLARMTIVQALYVGLIGWAIGSGVAALIGFLTRNSELSFYMPWELFLGAGIIIIFICTLSSLLNVSRIYQIQLGDIFK
jgi:putative ABC transport system permease protein